MRDKSHSWLVTCVIGLLVTQIFGCTAEAGIDEADISAIQGTINTVIKQIEAETTPEKREKLAKDLTELQYQLEAAVNKLMDSPQVQDALDSFNKKTD